MNTWDGGKSDDEAILQAIDILEAEGIPRENILKEPFITILPESHGAGLGAQPKLKPRAAHRIQQGTPGALTAGIIAHRARAAPPTAPARARVLINDGTALPIPGSIIRHPDILFHCPCHKCRQPTIIEIDGSWHDTKAGRKATDRRNRDYRYAELQVIVIPLSEYPLDTWHGHLQRRLRLHLRTVKRSHGR